ncbi:glycosyltransferase family 4 protein [Albimonas pacifica]|uniref:Glycosyltransferase involved in cell wall bisynthesis n=1 Tax=Albimonas pacifica TaxID=1114924 RepID=A0A1I3IKQ0_9RHOB|nr:glycosyltransferase family 4 protein [Albimonas pacifica]SFI48568.1 Glycosyltransferase involved in cell wall bisynthesis [Albimonas pacifica]
MQIAFVAASWPGEDSPNGAVAAVRHLAAGLREIGCGVRVIPLDGARGPDTIPPPPASRPPLRSRLAGRLGLSDPWIEAIGARLAAAARQAEAEGVELLAMPETHGWAAQVQAAVSIPVVVTLHGPWFLHRALKGRAPDRADARRVAREGRGLAACAGITAPSRDVLERARAFHGFPAGRPAACIPNPIPPGPALDRAALDAEEARSLLFVGRFDRHKGGDVMLDAFARLVAGGVDARLTFVGPDRGVEGPEGPLRLPQALAALPEAARARIDVRGQLPRAEVARLRLRRPVAAIASRYENLNYTLLETLAAGAATVCTAVGGPAELVRHGETGLLVPPEDPAALAAACARLLDDPALAARLGAAARARIVADFAPVPVAREMLAFFEQAIAARKRGRG